MISSRPKLNPIDLDGIFLSHRHIDHANDVNIIIEAMTNGGYTPKGVLFAPSDALDDDPVVLKHFRNHLENIHRLHEKGTYTIGSLSFETPIRHKHDVETYGARFYGSDLTLSYITDTEYFDGLESFYQSNVLVLNVVLLESRDGINHLSIGDVEKIISSIHPELCIITHFGMTVIRAKPWKIAEELSKRCGVKVIAASDGKMISLEKNDIF